MFGRAKKRHSAFIQGEDFYARPMIEKLEDRVLFNITAFELGGGGSATEG